MAGVLTTDHPAWHRYDDGSRARAVRTGSGLWRVRHDRQGLHLDCVAGAEDAKPVVRVTDPADLPEAAPAALRRELAGLGAFRRLANPWLWDAITTAVLRQVVRAAQARTLYRTWCSTYGTAVGGPGEALAVAPTHTRVLELSENDFAAVGAKFHCTALQAAAEQYGRHHEAWHRLDAPALADALTTVSRIGPWTARAAAADFTGDFSIYPHDDLAVRTWAAQVAPGYPWPDKKDRAFGPLWTGWAAGDRTALHTLTLATLTWGAHAR
ncbi:DNA glycosylase family protein [Streptomyces acidiscabies]|uniref:DNA-3-methyladenine glycosylase n=1 Tax=Streptomyces acidiscabies TaxID=42234 RepID=A0ABU4MAS0_9ACTN|nr:hypothetical protein [Streptomyces acidiscabies]MDX3024936.1 hypothetical protein [Streptomyces acidiscabies]